MDMGRSDAGDRDRRLRLANSSPDVKALFNAPAYIYNEHLDPEVNYMPEPAIEYWTPMPPIVCLVVLNNYLTDVGWQGSGAPHRTRHSEDALKRGSDSLLEAKLKEQISKPRSLQNRAQSLDLTVSLSRITESLRGAPESPTTSTGDTGGNSSPSSATAPTFPSVYGPRPTAVGTSAQDLALDEEAIDEVSRVISNLGL